MDENSEQVVRLRRRAPNPSFELATAALIHARGPASIVSSLLLAGITLAYVFVVLPSRFLIRILVGRPVKDSGQFNQRP